MSKSNPRDHSSAVTIGSIRTARTFSNVVSPPVIFAVMGLALALAQRPFWIGFAWAAVYGFFVSLLPILFVVYMLRTQRISDLHMNTARERRLPYLFGVGGAILAVLTVYLFNGPELLKCLSIFSLLSLGILGAVNMVWLISIHTTSITAAAVISSLVFEWWVGLLILPLIILVSWARLFLKRHTPAQVLAGIGLGLLLVLTMIQFNCFNPI